MHASNEKRGMNGRYHLWLSRQTRSFLISVTLSRDCERPRLDSYVSTFLQGPRLHLLPVPRAWILIPDSDKLKETASFIIECSHCLTYWPLLSQPFCFRLTIERRKPRPLAQLELRNSRIGFRVNWSFAIGR